MASSWNSQSGFQAADPNDPNEPDNGSDVEYGGTRESVTRSRHNRIGEGRSWRNYPELVGTSLGYDWRQYDFNDISPHSRNTERSRSGGEEEEQKDPLARESDMAPKDSDIGRPTQTVVGTDIERRQHPGYHITGTEVHQQYPIGEIGGKRGALGPGYGPSASYGNGRGFRGSIGAATPAIGPAPMKAIGMAPENRGPRQGTGASQSGILRARQNIMYPQQGNTAAGMVSARDSVIDVPSWET